MKKDSVKIFLKLNTDPGCRVCFLKTGYIGAKNESRGIWMTFEWFGHTKSNSEQLYTKKNGK